MREAGKGITPRDLGAYGVGLAVTVVSALLTGPVIPFPFNILVSFGLGGTALYGAHKVLDPDTVAEKEARQMEREYRLLLREIADIGKRTAEAGQRWCVGAKASPHLAEIAKTIEKILERYRQRRDFAGASATLIVLRKFDEVLAHYVKVKCDELFLDRQEAARVIAEMEEHVIPMVEEALESLGRKLDSRETLSTDIDKETMESMLRSLDLIDHPKDPEDGSPRPEEAPHDA